MSLRADLGRSEEQSFLSGKGFQDEKRPAQAPSVLSDPKVGV